MSLYRRRVINSQFIRWLARAGNCLSCRRGRRSYVTRRYVTLSCDLDLWPGDPDLTFDLEHLSYAGCNQTMYQIWAKWALRSGILAISIYDLMTLTCITSCTRLWDNFYYVWTLSTYPFWLNAFFSLHIYSYVTLWPWPLTRPCTCVVDRM